MKHKLRAFWHWINCPCKMYVFKYGRYTVYLECVKCNYTTKGWDLNEEISGVYSTGSLARSHTSRNIVSD